MLVNCRAPGIFINRIFIKKHCLNTHKPLRSILTYNVDGTHNKVKQILEVVDIIFYYKTYLEQILLIVFSLGKQNFILRFSQLKAYNSKVDLQKKYIVTTCYPIYCSSCQDIQKIDKQQIQALNTCYSNSFPAFAKDPKNKTSAPYILYGYEKKLGDCIYITCLFLLFLDL